jgi:Putative  PD-(D/E)XK family member, (DUF4420)
MKIADIWRELERDPRESYVGYLNRRLIPELKYDLILAIEKPQNIRLLMLRVRTSSIKRDLSFPKSIGFEVRQFRLEGDDSSYVTIQLILSNSRYSDIFTSLVQDIVDRLTLIPAETDAVREFIARLRQWQAFLEKYPPEGLSQSKQQGLYGELWCLRQTLIPQLSWTGPNGTQQDFQLPNCAIEVKTTIAKQHQKLSISSERQLDDTNTGTLLLYHLSLDSRQGRGESLVEIIATVRTLVAQDLTAQTQLEALLLAIGYLDTQAHLYEGTGYSIREENYFQVVDDFPRILESDLRNGIGDVRYTISVAECKRFSLLEAEAISLIGQNHE